MHQGQEEINKLSEGMGGHPKLFILVGVQSAAKRNKQVLERSVQVFKRNLKKGRGSAREERKNTSKSKLCRKKNIYIYV